ncbi:acetyl-CoA carboxylase biotin carboxylase subunit family protein [Streptomyces sp. NPDC058231]|uniref:ATP-grasp domain-containing protein n=1 Tax=Streptomyces sp. NPDC058231 TaxID=3346392 RepID=UPI0036E1E77C
MPSLEAEAGRRVLVVGWKAKAIRALARHGAVVTSVVTPGEAAKCRSLGLGRTLVAADPTRVEDVAAVLARHDESAADFDVVCSPQELTVLTAALLGAPAGNSAIPHRTALALRDKAVQKAAVRAARLPVASSSVCAHTGDLADVAADGPVVVKPLSGAGSADTYRVDTPAEASRLAKQLTEQGPAVPWLVEEFIDGTEMQVDGVVRDGTLLFMSVARYLHNLIHIHDGALVGAAALAPGAHPELYGRIGGLAARALEALGFEDGVFHMEVFVDRDRVVFSECGGRVGGGLTDEMLRHRFGTDIYDEWARAVLGLPTAVAEKEPDTGDSVGYIHLTVPSGRVTAAPTHEELAARPGVLHAELDVNVGDVVGDLTVSSHLRAARVLIRGADDTSVTADLHSLAQWFGQATTVGPVP